MKWAEVNKMLRNSFAAAVQIEPQEYYDYFLIELRETDTFHPWDTDSYLCELTHNTDLSEVDRDELDQAAWECITEMADKLEDWLSDKWNHAPGYQKPSKVTIKPEVALDVFLARLLDPETV